jgi:hypothetical protein
MSASIGPVNENIKKVLDASNALVRDRRETERKRERERERERKRKRKRERERRERKRMRDHRTITHHDVIRSLVRKSAMRPSKPSKLSSVISLRHPCQLLSAAIPILLLRTEDDLSRSVRRLS